MGGSYQTIIRKLRKISVRGPSKKDLELKIIRVRFKKNRRREK